MKCFQVLSPFAFASLPIVSMALVINATRRDAASLQAAFATAANAHQNFHGHHADFPEFIVDALDAANHGFNYIVSHGTQNYTFDGTEGVDWGHQTVDYFGGKHHFQYEIVIGGSGNFHKKEINLQAIPQDKNLRYKGEVVAVGDYEDGITITFADRYVF